MDGSSASLIVIPIVVVISLAAWLLLIAYAASHPQWKHGPAADRQLGTAEPRPAYQAQARADHDATPDQPVKLAA